MNTVNTTALAKRFSRTTLYVTKKLIDAGVTPVSEMTIASGRTYRLWNEDEAMRVLRSKIGQRRKVKTPLARLQDQLASLQRDVLALFKQQDKR